MAVSTDTVRPKRVPRILGAFAIAIVLIFGAYVVSNPNLFNPQVANAASTQELLAAFAKQTGPDGKPLWEDELIATSSTTPALANTTLGGELNSSSTSDTGPSTLTDQFAENLFEQYVSQLGGTQPSDDDLTTFAQNAINSVVQDHSQQDTYAQTSESIQGSGPQALVSYAAAADQAIAANTADTSKTEIDYFADVVEKNDTNEITQIAEIGKAYSGLAPALMRIPVPSEAQYAQLEIANAAARLGVDINDMAAFESDPLLSYIGLNAYQTDAPALAKGFSDMATVFQNEGVTIQQGNPGYDFYSILTTAGPTATSTSQ